ncbi:MAG: class I SAM-dependent methyltransferase [Thiobacillus sp.]
MKIDIGCGGKKKEGYVGLDQYPMPGVDHVVNIGTEVWPFENGSVGEAYSSNFLEHLTNLNGANERVHFFNELFRVLRFGAKAFIAIPHWNSCRYYGDPTHKEPFSEFGVYYLNREWRLSQAPHTDIVWNPKGYSCDFDSSLGYVLQPKFRNLKIEEKEYTQARLRDAVEELHLHLVRR